MTAYELWTRLHCRGIALDIAADGIAVTAPKGALTDRDRAALKEHKAELTRLLSDAARRPRAAMVHAPVLGCDILAVEIDADAPNGHAGPVYIRAELELMRGLDPDELRMIHASKVTFGGSYQGRGENPHPPAWKPGDRVRGYAGERWETGTVVDVWNENGHTLPSHLGMVAVQPDGKPYEALFRPARLWGAADEDVPTAHDPNDRGGSAVVQ